MEVSATPPWRAGSSGADLSARDAHGALDRATRWIESYLGDPSRYPVLAQVAPGDIARQLPASPPELGEAMDDILDDFEKIVLPGITHWQHPGFMGYFAITGSVPGVVAEMLAAALNVNGMLWRTSPSVTELEERALDWLRQMLGLAPGWFGVINDTASISTMLALAAAREAMPGLDIRMRGMAGRFDLPVLRVYASEQCHSSVDKGAITLGFGHDNVVHIPVDADFRMRPEELADRVARDRALGMLPLAVVATVGTTSSASVDPVPDIADVCERERLWLHVDASYAGVAAIVPEWRHVLAGVDRADSLVVNPHKWLFTPVDLSAMYTRRPDVLRRAFSLVPEYLTTTEHADVVNLMDYGVQLGRRFRALKLWFVIRAFGVSGIVERLRDHIASAQFIAERIRSTEGWTLAAPVRFSLVCFRYRPRGATDAEGDRLTAAILERVNSRGRFLMSHTRLNDRFAIRLAIGNMRTRRHHVEAAWDELQLAAAELT